MPLSKEVMEQVNKQYLEFKYISIYIFTDGKGKNYITSPRKALKTALKKVSIKDTKNIGFHIFRHTFASFKQQETNYKGDILEPMSIENISYMLGRSDISITSRVYSKPSK